MENDDGNIHDGLPRPPRGHGIHPKHHKTRRSGKGRPKKSDIELAIEQLVDWEKLDFDGSSVVGKSDRELRRSANRKALEMLPHVLRMTMMILQHADKATDRLAAARFIRELCDMQTGDEKVINPIGKPQEISETEIMTLLSEPKEATIPQKNFDPNMAEIEGLDEQA